MRNRITLKSGFLEDKVVMTDENLFEFFSIPLLKGEPDACVKRR